MILNKWNVKKHTYEPYEIPDEWNCPLYSEYLDQIVNCPQCGKELQYGNTYTSKEIHNNIGLGYGVCEKCYQEEWERKRGEYEKNANE